MNNTTSELFPDTYLDYEFKTYVYQGFAFEHPIYLYVWEILVVISVAIAVLFILTLLRKKLRSTTSYILVAISISDSLTGLVTLPSYIMVYQELVKAEDNPSTLNESYYDYSYFEYYDINITAYQTDLQDSVNTIPNAYILSKQLCDIFMISKFFLTKSFHTISVWLTVFLGVQRCLSVWLPFSAPAWFSKRKTIIICLAIVVVSPAVHMFHLFNDKSIQGYCYWKVDEECSEGSCIQLWVVLILSHLVPCIVLTVTTVLMVKNLLKSSFQKSRSESSKKFKRGSEVVEDENRLVSKIVTAIVIVFLLTEAPYGLFLLYLSVANKETIDQLLKTSRAVHVLYEITMVLSFNANFFIYNAFNRRFRVEIRNMFSCCHCSKNKKESVRPMPSQSHSSSQNPPETELSTLT